MMSIQNVMQMTRLVSYAKVGHNEFYATAIKIVTALVFITSVKEINDPQFNQNTSLYLLNCVVCN